LIAELTRNNLAISTSAKTTPEDLAALRRNEPCGRPPPLRAQSGNVGTGFPEKLCANKKVWIRIVSVRNDPDLAFALYPRTRISFFDKPVIKIPGEVKTALALPRFL
jgi:hypothetical protein